MVMKYAALDTMAGGPGLDLVIDDQGSRAAIISNIYIALYKVARARLEPRVWCAGDAACPSASRGGQVVIHVDLMPRACVIVQMELVDVHA